MPSKRPRESASQQWQRDRRRSRRSDQLQGNDSRGQTRTELQVDEEIMPVGRCFRAGHRQVRRRTLHAGAAQIFTGKQQGEGRRVVDPPVGGLDLAHDRLANCRLANYGTLSGRRIGLRPCRLRQEAGQNQQQRDGAFVPHDVSRAPIQADQPNREEHANYERRAKDPSCSGESGDA